MAANGRWSEKAKTAPMDCSTRPRNVPTSRPTGPSRRLAVTLVLAGLYMLNAYFFVIPHQKQSAKRCLPRAFDYYGHFMVIYVYVVVISGATYRDAKIRRKLCRNTRSLT